MQPFDELHCLPAPGNDLVNLGQQAGALLAAQRAVDAAGNGTGSMHALASGEAYDFLAEPAQQHPLASDFGVRRGDADDVAPTRVAVEAEQQIG
ncbi:MAG: hypothetical protein AW07_00830 [Candidatus Accumulibacter sp. SK-11]|nr:MAG: hypothetical protein AW07_00830 [Candidatus Accumulibacter sp. SK-11]